MSTVTKIQKSIVSFAVKTPQYVLIQTLSFTSNKEITDGKSMDLVDLGRNTNGELDEAVVYDAVDRELSSFIQVCKSCEVAAVGNYSDEATRFAYEVPGDV